MKDPRAFIAADGLLGGVWLLLFEGVAFGFAFDEDVEVDVDGVMLDLDLDLDLDTEEGMGECHCAVEEVGVDRGMILDFTFDLGWEGGVPVEIGTLESEL